MNHQLFEVLNQLDRASAPLLALSDAIAAVPPLPVLPTASRFAGLFAAMQASDSPLMRLAELAATFPQPGRLEQMSTLLPPIDGPLLRLVEMLEPDPNSPVAEPLFEALPIAARSRG